MIVTKKAPKIIKAVFYNWLKIKFSDPYSKFSNTPNTEVINLVKPSSLH